MALRPSLFLVCLLMLLMLGKEVAHAQQRIHFGVFLDNTSVSWSAVKLAVDSINRRRDILPNRVIQLVSVMPSPNRFTATLAICDLLQSPLSIILGPPTSGNSYPVADMSNGHRIPMITFRATDPQLATYQYFARVIPPDSDQARAIIGTVRKLNWQRLAVWFTNDVYGSHSVPYLLEAAVKGGVTVSMAYPLTTISTEWKENIDGAFRGLYDRQLKIVVVFATRNTTIEVLREAKARGFAGRNITEYVWIASEAFISEDADPFLGDTTFAREMRGMFVTKPAVQPGTELTQFESLWKNASHPGTGPGTTPSSSSALAYDAVVTAALALNATVAQLGAAYTEFQAVDCLKRDQWVHGPTVLANLRKVAFTGATGSLAFDNSLEPNSSLFDILNLQPFGATGSAFFSVGSWEKPDQLNLSVDKVWWPGGGNIIPSDMPSLQGRHIKWLGYHSEPLLFESNGQPVGYCVDMLAELGKRLGFTSSITMADRQLSSNSLVELVGDHKTEFEGGVGAIAITARREQLASLTQPFLDMGLRIVLKVPEFKVDYWTWTGPFEPAVWALWGVFILVTGVIFWFIEHEYNEYVSTRLMNGLAKSIWYAFTTQIGAADGAPATATGRALSAGLFFVGMLFTSAYTANLVAFLVKTDSQWPVDSIDDLLNGKAVIPFHKIAVIRGGTTEQWYRATFHTHESFAVSNLDEIILALRNGSATIGISDATLLVHRVQRECDMALRGPVFHPLGYGLVLTRDFPFVSDISNVILDMKEDGTLETIYDTYFTNTGECAAQAEEEQQLTALSVPRMAGVFLVFGVFVLATLILYIARLFDTKVWSITTLLGVLCLRTRRKKPQEEKAWRMSRKESEHSLDTELLPK